MPVPVPFGQFVPVESPVHRLDARAKIGLVVAYTAMLFGIDSWIGLAVAALVSVATVRASTVPFRLALRGIMPIAWLLGFTIVINGLFPAVRAEPLLSVGSLTLDRTGLATGVFFAIRIVLLLLGTSLLTLTTSPVSLTDALTDLMRPLERLRFPVDDAAMMMSIALRFMPTTAEEAERIVVAQTARGAQFSEGGPVARARAWIPVLIPLFVRLFRRADDLALAMESRCYRGHGRTRLREAVMRPSDWIALGFGTVVLIGIAVVL